MQPHEIEPYYRILLTIDVGTWVQWQISSAGPLMKGRVLRMYPNGNGQYKGKHNAFFMVGVDGSKTANFSVSFDNPTIQKLETIT